MTARALFLDASPGERRGVVTVGGRPERLLIERYDDLPAQGAGAKSVARVSRVEHAQRCAFLDLGGGPEALLSFPAGGKAPHEGMHVEIEILSPARGAKGAQARWLAPAVGPVRLVSPPASLEDRLRAFAPTVAIATGSEARDAADLAEETALSTIHALPSGGRIYVEPTQALVAVDVDLGPAFSLGRQAAARANREALETGARVMRLKGLGGIVAVDLVGRGHDGAALSALAKAAFEADGPGVSIGPISRFGIFELALPWRARPVAEILLGPDGRLSAQSAALRLLRAIERAAGPGQRVEAVCAPPVAAAAEKFVPDLAAKIGSRFAIRSDPARDLETFEVSAR